MTDLLAAARHEHAMQVILHTLFTSFGRAGLVYWSDYERSKRR
jgi:hypothetical protein